MLTGCLCGLCGFRKVRVDEVFVFLIPLNYKRKNSLETPVLIIHF